MNSSKKPLLSIVIPTKDRPQIFSISLEKAVKATTDLNIEIIVINDSAQSLDENFSTYKNVKIFNNNGKGVASARNFGASKSNSDLLLFLDDDMWLSRENIDNYLNLYNQLGDVVINLNWEYPDYLKSILEETAIGRYLVSKDFTTMKGWNKGNNWNDNELFESTGIAGANLFISKRNYNKLGGYNETFPFAGFEDYDFSKRIEASGIKTFIYPLSMMYHNEANKLVLKGWLEKNYKSAITKRHAANIGYAELVSKRSYFKRVIYFIMIPFSGILIFIASLFSRNSKYDTIYQKVVDMLTGLSIYKGYNGYSKSL